jgi:hypothetical protein
LTRLTVIGWPKHVATTTVFAYCACLLAVVAAGLFAQSLGDSWVAVTGAVAVAMAVIMWRSRTTVSISAEEVVVSPDGLFGTRIRLPMGGLMRADVGSEPSLILTMSSGARITVGPWAPVSAKSLRAYEEKCTMLAREIQEAIAQEPQVTHDSGHSWGE